MELRPRGVRVCAVLPGGTATDFTYSRRVYGEEEAKSYSSSLKKSSAALANMEQGGMSPSLVAEKIVSLCERRDPPPLLVVGKQNSALHVMRRLLPERTVDWMIRKKFNQ
jgi:short-subunit dehydrogenase